jgi:hypothetical protein
MPARLFYRPPSDLVDPSQLAMLQPHERIVNSDEIAGLVAPAYNLAVSPTSTQSERREAFTAALKALIDSGTLTPRSHYGDERFCLVTPVQSLLVGRSRQSEDAQVVTA